MPITFNLRHLDIKAVSLVGEIDPKELEIGFDELVHLPLPITYQIIVEKLDAGILARGLIEVPLECECSRCLKKYSEKLKIDPWAAHLELEGEERVEVANDIVDLTPYLREDILLRLPQHPLCETECAGLSWPSEIPRKKSDPVEDVSSPWSELNKLKLKK